MGASVMTYPCYVVLSPSGWPDCLKTEEGMAVCVFTDEQLAGRYCEAKRRAIRQRTGEDVRDFHLIGFEHPEALLAAFHKAAPDLAEKGVEAVAIDPNDTLHVRQILLADFLEDVRRSL
jgi:hypothetical protein